MERALVGTDGTGPDAMSVQQPIERVRAAITAFIGLEAASGIVLLAVALLALAASNSPMAPLYRQALELPVGIKIGTFALDKPLLLWINDGLMAVFFLLVGLEIKRELVEGELSSPAQAALPAISALGGMAVPALVYAAINWGDPTALRGWAIPAATDIAFALGVLSLLGSRVPSSLKVFLVALAILDDLGAIVIIAIFYTSELSLLSLGLAAAVLVSLALLNLLGVDTDHPLCLARDRAVGVRAQVGSACDPGRRRHRFRHPDRCQVHSPSVRRCATWNMRSTRGSPIW